MDRERACPTCGTPQSIYEAVEAAIEGDGRNGKRIGSLDDLTSAAVLAERERCAKIAEAGITGAQFPNYEGGYDSACEDIAARIRSGE